MYKIQVKKSAQKELEQISPPYNQKIVDSIDNSLKVRGQKA